MGGRSGCHASRLVIFVDSSVWIDFFRGVSSPQVERLDELLGSEPIAIGDLVLTEVLQGFRRDRDFEQAKSLLMSLFWIELGGQRVALDAARNYRVLRKMGVTIRKTVDTVIASRCIVSDYALLYSDRDFDPFVRHLGLRSAMP